MEASPTHWPRYEAIDGKLIVTPAPRIAHQEMLELLRDALEPYAIEVLSPSSRTRDRLIKRRFLRRVAVPEYWVVDLYRRIVERWRPDDGHAEVLATSLVWHPPGPNEPLTIDLASLFADVHG